MRKVLFFSFFLSFCLSTYAQFESKGLKARFYDGRFSIFASDSQLAKEVGIKVRKIYEKVSKDIGYSGVFKDRYQILIWRKKKNFLKFIDKLNLKTRPDIVTAIALYNFKGSPTVAGYLDKNLFTIHLPHEFTHLILTELLGVKGEKIPLWLNEGLATYEGGPPLKYVKSFLRKKIRSGDYIRLSKLIKIKQYPEDNEMTKLFYLESQSLVAYLLNHKKKRFPSFLRWYVVHKDPFGKAYLYSYGGTSQIEIIEKKWLSYIMR